MIANNVCFKALNRTLSDCPLNPRWYSFQSFTICTADLIINIDNAYQEDHLKKP